MKISEQTGKPYGLLDHYLGVLQLLGQAPPDQLDESARQWFAQFNEQTWLNEDEFIADFSELAYNFALLAEEVRAEGKASAFVMDSFMVLALQMMEDLKDLAALGYFIKDPKAPTP